MRTGSPGLPDPLGQYAAVVQALQNASPALTAILGNELGAITSGRGPDNLAASRAITNTFYSQNEVAARFAETLANPAVPARAFARQDQEAIFAFIEFAMGWGAKNFPGIPVPAPMEGNMIDAGPAMTEDERDAEAPAPLTTSFSTVSTDPAAAGPLSSTGYAFAGAAFQIGYGAPPSGPSHVENGITISNYSGLPAFVAEGGVITMTNREDIGMGGPSGGPGATPGAGTGVDPGVQAP